MIALLAAVLASTPLPPLLDRLRLSVPDARSITDLQVCAPSRVSPDGREALVLVALNRPRVAREFYLAVWQDGRFARLDDMSRMGVPRLGLRREQLERQFADCPWVPSADLKAAWAELPQ
jgi:hypothetical protein